MFLNHSKNNVAKTIGFTTVPTLMLLTPLVLQLFQQKKKQLLEHLTVDISKINAAKTNGFSNIVFVNVVKPMI